MEKFTNIKVLAWDFDGTLYPLNDALWKEIREAQYRVIMHHTGWDHEKTVAEFMKLYKTVTPSGTQVASQLSNISIVEAALESEQYFDRTKYLSHDQKLIDLFTTLTHYRHVMLVNGKRSELEKAVTKLGLIPDPFEMYITPEITGVVKPNLKHFQALLAYTKLPPEQHLVIGDRKSVDLVPAKQLGIKTCLVWGKISVYDVPLVLEK